MSRHEPRPEFWLWSAGSCTPSARRLCRLQPRRAPQRRHEERRAAPATHTHIHVSSERQQCIMGQQRWDGQYFTGQRLQWLQFAFGHQHGVDFSRHRRRHLHAPLRSSRRVCRRHTRLARNNTRFTPIPPAVHTPADDRAL